MSLVLNNSALPDQLRPFAIRETCKKFQDVKVCGIDITDYTNFLKDGQERHHISIMGSFGLLQLTAEEATTLGTALVLIASAQAARLQQGGAA